MKRVEKTKSNNKAKRYDVDPSDSGSVYKPDQCQLKLGVCGYLVRSKYPPVHVYKCMRGEHGGPTFNESFSSM